MLRKHFPCPDLSARAAGLSVWYRHATHLDSQQQPLELYVAFQMSLSTNTYPATLEMLFLDADKTLVCFVCGHVPLMAHRHVYVLTPFFSASTETVCPFRVVCRYLDFWGSVLYLQEMSVG